MLTLVMVCIVSLTRKIPPKDTAVWYCNGKVFMPLSVKQNIICKSLNADYQHYKKI